MKKSRIDPLVWLLIVVGIVIAILYGFVFYVTLHDVHRSL